MKYCERPFKYLYVMPNGNVFLCGWATKPIGNLLQQDLDEMWNNDVAKEFREAIRDNSFKWCKTTGCPFCENNSLPLYDENDEKLEELFTPADMPTEYNLAIDYTCNHSCPSCRHEVFVPNEQYKKNMETIVEKLMPYLPHAEYIGTDGQGDCFASPTVMQLLEKLQPKNPQMRITLETNGVFFDQEHWNRISHLSKQHIRVVVTPNSFERATYKYLSGGHDNLDKLLSNLHFISGLRKKELVNDFAVSIVVQDRNFRELPAFTQRCFDDFEVDSVTVKPIYKWFKLTEKEYLEKDILNPLHPYFDEYQEVWKDERLQDPRIFWWGSKNIHPSQMLAADKFYKLFNVTAHLLEIVATDSRAIESWLKENGYNQIGIYGYGRMGKILHKSIAGMTKFIIDKRNICINSDVDFVLASTEVYPQMDLIIVTPFYEYGTIAENISIRTSATIISLEELVQQMKGSCKD